MTPNYLSVGLTGYCRLLFILYLNDIVNCLQNYKYLLYADDIVLDKDIDLEKNPRDVESFQIDFTEIIEWCSINELTLNIKKTKAQFFPRNRNVDCKLFKEQHVIKMKNQDINYTEVFKYLGVEIDSYLLLLSRDLNFAYDLGYSTILYLWITKKHLKLLVTEY